MSLGLEVHLLPFLNKNKNQGVAGLIIKQRTPDEKPQENQDDNDQDAAIHACAQDLISAVHAHDVKATAEAMRAAFDILESMPHDEIEHDKPEPHSYDAQKGE